MSIGLEIAKRALATHKTVLDAIGHNVANVNTEGYSRQKVDLASTQPLEIPVINKNNPFVALGTGVKVSQIRRIRDEFLDTQKRDVSLDYGTWSQQAVSYDMIEGIFNEPSDTGIMANLDAFWNSWQSLAVPDPSDPGARSNLVSQADIMATSFQVTRDQLSDLQKNHNTDIKYTVDKINDYADQLGVLNGQIIVSEATSDANDLRDKRTQILSELSALVNVQYYEDSYGSSTVAVGGSFIVADQNVNHLSVKENSTNGGFYDVVWEESTKQATITGGELYGLIEARDSNVPKYIDYLDEIASELITNVNNQHKQGYASDGTTGSNFFTGSSATDISVTSDLVYDPSRIAASSRSDNIAGNGENAVAIAQIRNSLLMNSNTTSIDSYYQSVISQLGVDTAEAQTFLDTNDSLINQLNNQIQSVSGVSIDEEMSEMIKAEHAYSAAAKYIQVIKNTLDILMSIV